MTCMIDTSVETGHVRIVTVHVRGHFGASDGDAMWEVCQPDHERFQIYYFDLAEVSEVDSDGIAWLQDFLAWARRAGRSVRILNAPVNARGQLARAGIASSGTAVYGMPLNSDNTRSLDVPSLSGSTAAAG